MSKIVFPVEATHIMLFARAIGDSNPVYCDAEAARKTHAKGVIAPPTFLQAVAHFNPEQLRPTPGMPWLGSGKTPSGVAEQPISSSGLQAGQEYTYHRPVRPGDVLTAELKPGKTWEKESKRRRSGKLVFRERITEYRDAKGELVVTAVSVGVTAITSADAA